MKHSKWAKKPINHNPWIGEAGSKPKKIKMTHQRCPVCSHYVPALAVKHNDPYCSRACAEISYGTANTSSWLTEERRKMRESVIPRIGGRS